MDRKSLYAPLAGAVLVGFVVGACTRQVPGINRGGSGGGSDGLTAPAQAQTPAFRSADDLRKLSTEYAGIASRVTPAVVNITSQQIIPGRVLRDPFFSFFGDSGPMFREPDREAQSLGSGVIMDGRGIILTNNHVIANATTITVTLNDRRRFPAKLLGTDPDSDVAVLKINATRLPVLTWANSDRLQVGDIVMAIGSPFNLSSTVTQGIVSAKGRHDLGISNYEDFLQTDAAINPGNSGGALVDVDGNLVGINSAILSQSGGNQGIGLAIPANLARKVSDQLTASGHVTRGWLGIVVRPITDDMVQRLGLPGLQGVVVSGIYERGPAATLAWSQADDVILKANGQALDSPGQFRNMVGDLAPGSQLTLEVWQNGKTQTFTVQLARRPAGVQGV